MTDENNPDLLNEKPLSDERSSSFEYVESLEHNEETPRRKSLTELTNNNDSHIQPNENGHPIEDSPTIQSNENDSTVSQSVEETTLPVFTQPIDNSNQQINDQDSPQTTEKSSEQTNHFHEENPPSPIHSDDHPNSFSADTSNSDTSFQTQTDLDHKPEEIKSQHQLDEEEIPPVEFPADQRATSTEKRHSLSNSDPLITDDRPLTELETPYEDHHQQEDENSSFQSPEDEKSVNNETYANESLLNTSNENPINPITFGSFLPDVVSETFEQNQGDFNPEQFQSENILQDENSLQQNPADFTEEDFPPLPPPSNPPQMVLSEEDYPSLPSAKITLEQTSTKEEEKPLLFSNNEFIPSPPEDVLGNKTLFKQTIVKGESNSRPTRSTMVTISYSLSLVNSLTLNTRLIEKVSNERFFLSENDLIPAIDICVHLMDRGEQASIDSDVRHCYGEIGCEEKQIPAITSLNPYRMRIELELHHWTTPADVQRLSIDERLHWGDKKRQMGNFYYRRQDYKSSLQCYHGALRFLDTDNNPLLISFDQSQKSILTDRFIQVENNVAQVNLLLNNYQACLNAVNNVLKHDPRNVKALFRQGKALFELGSYDQAIQPLKFYIQIQRGNSTTAADNDKANEMISICEQKLANYQKNEKEIYRRMFQPTTTTTNQQNQQNQRKNPNQIDNTENNWWPYLALGSAALGVIGLLTFMKYRKVS